VAGKPIRIAFLGDTKDLQSNLGKAESAMRSAGDEATKQGSRIDSSFSTAAEGADNVASKGSQAAGALAGLGSLGVLAGGSIGKIGAGAVIAGTGVQALADAGDLLNVVTESTIVKSTLAKGAMIGNAIATKAVAGATRAYTGVQWLLNAALSANPIGAVVVGLGLLVGGFILAYKKVTPFRNIVNAAFGSVRRAAGPVVSLFTKGIPNAVGFVVGFVKAHWKPIVGIMLGPIGLLVVGITGHLDDIRSGFTNVVGFIGGIPGKIRGKISAFTSAGGDLIGGLVHGLSNPVGSVGPVAQSIVNGVIGFLNSHLPHSLSINKGPLHITVPLFPTIPALASGGIVTGPTLALIGDNPGGREAVIPLDRYDLSGRREYHITVNAPVGADAYTIGETLVSYIREYEEGGAA
jgi:hypothetical protein